MEFKSIDQIRKEFNLSTYDRKEVRNELIKIRNKIHPDKNGGIPKNEIENELVIKVNKAIDFLESNKDETSLTIVTKTMHDLIQIMAEQGMALKTNQIEDRLNKKIDYSISESIKFARGPKITLTAITASLSFIFLLPDQISKHPILSKVLDPMNPIVQSLWFLFLFYTITLWALTYYRDEKNKNTLKSLKLESVQNDLFVEYLIKLKRESRNTCRDLVMTFTKIDFVNFIMFRNNRYRYLRSNPLFVLFSFFRPTGLQEDAAQDIAEIIIKRAIETEIIEKVTNNKSFIENYRVIDYSIFKEKEF